MSQKPVWIGLLLLVVLSSCKEKSVNLAQDDLRDYFWNIEDYDQPKIHVYQRDSFGHFSNYYEKVESIGSNQLQMTQFGKTFKMLETNVYRIGYKGVYMERAQFKSGLTDRIIEASIESGLVYPFIRPNDELGIKASYTIDEEKWTRVDSWFLKELDTLSISDTAIPAIKASGVWKRERINREGTEATDWVMAYTMWYGKGLGPIQSIIEDKTGNSVSSMYLKTLTLDEFDELKDSLTNN